MRNPKHDTLEATKADSKKVRLDLLPTESLREIAKVMEFGSKKYGDYNWTKGMQWSRMYAAALRHLFAFWEGQDLDEESGISHLAHLGCCVQFLIYYQKKNKGVDDRPKDTQK
jgi:hypothetical protein